MMVTDMEVWLTTIDNPYDPFTQFDEWKHFDEDEKGYNSLAYLARISQATIDMPEKQYNQEVESAINEIVYYDLLGLYKKVKKDVKTEENNDSSNDENK